MAEEGGGGGDADLALRPYQEEMLTQALEDNVCGGGGSTVRVTVGVGELGEVSGLRQT